MRAVVPALVMATVPFVTTVTATYVPLREYSGSTFFDKWVYWGNVDNTTHGNVIYLDRAPANEQRLTYVDDAGHAIIRVDNTTTIAPATSVNRASIRITTQDTYNVGTLWIMDANHIPYGCSVWPSFWSLGATKKWPHAGEIDIIEGINLSKANQMALHTDPQCVQSPNPWQSGVTVRANCTGHRGCSVREAKPDSYGHGFAKAGGGVYAVQMDASGVFIWFWTRSQVPDIIKTASPITNMDVAQFGIPSAAYPASGCNITKFFGPQQLILDTTLCGTWAGLPDAYASTCPGNCVLDNVIGPGSPKYDTAYWNITYIRTYIAEDLARPSSPALPSTTTRVNSGANNGNRVPTSLGGQYWPMLGALAAVLSFI